MEQNQFNSLQFSSVAPSCPTLCDLMDCSRPDFPDHHQLLKPTQTHVHHISDAIHHLILYRPLLLQLSIFPASGSFPMCWFFASGGQSIGVSASESVLPMNIQDWFPLKLTGWISLQSKGLSRVFSNTTVQKHQFFGTEPSSWSNSHICIWLLEKPQLWLYGCLLAKWCLCFLICCLGLSLLFFQGTTIF